MKLILCRNCNDVVKLHDKTIRSCACGKSKGRLHSDRYNAIYSGEAIPLGFANSSLLNAIRSQPEIGNGMEFTAFVIPQQCPTMIRVEMVE